MPHGAAGGRGGRVARIGIGADGWLTGVRRLRSPNHDRRPAGAGIDLIVVHGISLPPGQFGGRWIADLFLNRLDPDAHPYFAAVAALQVSAHLLVRRDGVVLQFVPLEARAWHAGASRFRGRERCNDFSIGIELEGTDDVPYTQRQYGRLSQLARLIMRAYPAIKADRIVGHCHIAPGRKTDPGPSFDWRGFRARLSR
jgi:AmpD protein